LANIPVEVNWFKKEFCFTCTYYKVASGKSDNDGKFSFNTTIDTTFFKDYFLSVRVPADTNYFSGSAIGGDDVNEERIYNFNLVALQNINLDFCPKTFPTIKLHRMLSDDFNNFSVEHSFHDKMAYLDYLISVSQFATDTTIKVETSSDIYTKVTWTKVFGLGQFTQKTDSLICTADGANTFNINY